MADELTILGELLRSKLEITIVGKVHSSDAETGKEEISSTHRFHLFLKGSVHYTIGNQTILLQAGDQTFVPAWQRRSWTLAGKEPCEILYCAFTTPNHLAPEPVLYRRRPSKKDFDAERSIFDKLLILHQEAGEKKKAFGRSRMSSPESAQENAARKSPSIKQDLHMEGELKATLARFFIEAASQGGETTPEIQCEIHPEIRRALVWISNHHVDSDALEVLYRGITRLLPTISAFCFMKLRERTRGRISTVSDSFEEGIF